MMTELVSCHELNNKLSLEKKDLIRKENSNLEGSVVLSNKNPCYMLALSN